MLTITIPNNNLNERKYIIDIIFNEFLDVEFQYKIGGFNYEITLVNNNKLIFEDHFLRAILKKQITISKNNKIYVLELSNTTKKLGFLILKNFFKLLSKDIFCPRITFISLLLYGCSNNSIF